MMLTNNFWIHHVCLVPRFTVNIISVAGLIRSGFNVTFGPDNAVIAAVSTNATGVSETKIAKSVPLDHSLNLWSFNLPRDPIPPNPNAESGDPLTAKRWLAYQSNDRYYDANGRRSSRPTTVGIASNRNRSNRGGVAGATPNGHAGVGDASGTAGASSRTSGPKPGAQHFQAAVSTGAVGIPQAVTDADTSDDE